MINKFFKKNILIDTTYLQDNLKNKRLKNNAINRRKKKLKRSIIVLYFLV